MSIAKAPSAKLSRQKPVFDLETFLPYELSVVTNRISRAFARRYASTYGLSIPEWRVMAIVGAFAPLSSNEVCDRAAMDKAKVSRAVSRLVARGLLARERNEEDQRLVVLSLTDDGRAIHRGIVPLAEEIEAQLVACLSEAERGALRRILRKLNTRVLEISPDGGDEADPD
jgi:DNA-binding MarR family transcriptional regulator